MGKEILETVVMGAGSHILGIELAMGAALVCGVVLARRRCYRAHAWCQSAVVLLNLLVIALYMVPAFRGQVLPAIPASLGESYYLLVTVHGALGIAAEALAIYLLLAAGTNLLPRWLRLRRYKLWMRSLLALWWLVLLLGIAVAE